MLWEVQGKKLSHEDQVKNQKKNEEKEKHKKYLEDQMQENRRVRDYANKMSPHEAKVNQKLIEYY
jgi:hypothetical protein